MDGFDSFKKEEQTLFEDFRRRINLQAAQAQIKKIEYNLSDVASGLAAIKAACADATNLKLGGVCVAPSFVKPCAAFLGNAQNRKSSLIACISYPNGGDTTEIKVKAVKQAIKNGADEVEVTAPIAQIRDGNFQYVKREIKKLRKAAKNRALRISAESSMLGSREVIKLCLIAADCKADSVKTSSQCRDGDGEKTIADIRSAIKDKCTIKAEGVSSVTEMSAAIDMGAVAVGSKNAPSVARYILAAAKNEVLA